MTLLRRTTTAALAACALVTGSLALAAPAQAAGLSGHPKWQDGSVGATFGCSLARQFIDPNLCAGVLGFPVP
ncbi:hypothetical protein [Kocuria flava]|uniref:Uncharacterized protein n=1 Tax=Kocuria flava TaxID=446860 RepID=A0A2N4T001_9MICC|nr:hypothetical protein [Kocuria flava]PLC11554.1 hypothetical protein AUQ48_03940 [Kocuria flava]